MMDTPDFARVIELERADAARAALDEAAKQLDAKHGAEQYQRAWRKAATFLRSFKPYTGRVKS